MRHTHQVISYVLGMDRDDFDASARTWIQRNRTRTTLLSFGHYCVTVSGSSRKALGRRGVPTPEKSSRVTGRVHLRLHLRLHLMF